MVFLSQALQAARRKGGFLDHIRVYVRGGPGGQGLPKYGGCGGRGGHVYVIGSENETLKSLLQRNPKKRFVGAAGQNSKLRALLGAPGEDLLIPAPPGVTVLNDSGRVLGELNEVKDRVLVAKGGLGGGPETNFLGQRGAATSVTLDLKLIADIGLVGFPNAGKSTFLSAVSRAAPKIASYPFTTLKPQLGVMQYEDSRQISVADLPGLIEGAHVNVGMGHHFLKHIERTKLLLFLVDVHGFQLNQDHPVRSAIETVLLLNKELQLYKDHLLAKPCVLALNKLDMPGSEEKVNEVMDQVKNMSRTIGEISEDLLPETLVQFDEVVAISAKAHLHTDYLKSRLRHWLDINADLELQQSAGKQRGTVDLGNQLKEHFAGGHYV